MASTKKNIRKKTKHAEQQDVIKENAAFTPVTG